MQRMWNYFKKMGKRAKTSDCLCLVITFFSSSSFGIKLGEKNYRSVSLSSLYVCFSHCLSCFLSFTHSHIEAHVQRLHHTLFTQSFSLKIWPLFLPLMDWLNGLLWSHPTTLTCLKCFMFSVAFHYMFIIFTFPNNPSSFTLITDISKNKSRSFFLQLAKGQRVRIQTQVFICLKASAVFFILSYLNKFFYMVVSKVL